MKEYFADIDSSISQMKDDGIDEIILMGHSTGGLTTSLYMASNPDSDIRALILNSPFLDWNLSSFQEKFLVGSVDNRQCISRHKDTCRAGRANMPKVC